MDVKAMRAKRDALEQEWLAEEEKLFSGGVPVEEQLRSFAARAAAEEQAMIDEFSVDDWDAIKGNSRFEKYWRGKNAKLKD